MIDVSSFTTGFFNGVFSVVLGLVKLILFPIDALITAYLPNFSNVLDAISSFFNNYIGSVISWAVSLSGLSQATISLIVSYYIFKLTLPLLVYSIKLVVSWYNKLKL